MMLGTLLASYAFSTAKRELNRLQCSRPPRAVLAVYSPFTCPCRPNNIVIALYSKQCADTSSVVCDFGRPFLKRFALCYRTVVCPVLSVCVVLSATLVYCGQTVGWIKMKLGTVARLGPGHIVRWGPSSPLTKQARIPSFGPCIIVAKQLD